MVKTILVSVITIAMTILLGLGIEFFMISIMDKWCLFNPWYLLFKNTSIYIIILFTILIFLSTIHKITRPVKVLVNKRAVIFSLITLMLVSLVGYGYFGWHYGNVGAGACSRSNINIDYYKYPGQDRHL
jgi:hypothetical protein